MKRRSFMTTGGVGLVATAIAAPAIAQSQPEINGGSRRAFLKAWTQFTEPPNISPDG
jgi:hypothetical protein